MFEGTEPREVASMASRINWTWLLRWRAIGAAAAVLLALLALRPGLNLPVGAAEPGDQSGTKQAEKPTAKEEVPMEEHPFGRRTPAPALDGGIGWINSAGPVDLKELRGKFVILDFWTYCCINCIHVLPELKKLERAYPNEVVVIGVHSAKFDGEQDSRNIAEAVLRYEIEHPVVNDAEHKIWDAYGVNSWPSFRIIDPEGNLVAGDSGEISFEAFDGFLKKFLPYYRERKLLNTEPIKFDLERAKAAQTPLRFPGKVMADEAGKRLFIADSNHNRIVVTSLEGKLLATIGSGTAGAADGGYATAQFDHPQGMALVGQTLYVADTENHLLRKVDLVKKRVTTISGTGKQGRNAWPGMADENAPLARLLDNTVPTRFVGLPKTTALNSPWDLWVDGKDLYIAMAGPHQIWKMPLDESEIGPYAGNGREDIRDGALLPPRPYQSGYSSFAQPSGLAGDGEWLYVADSEGSSIRAVPFDPKKEVRTVVGTSELPEGRLFVFGDRDGTGLAKYTGKRGTRPGVPETTGVLLQHALGVVHQGGKLYVADTYNNKIKEIDPATGATRTLAGTGAPGAADMPAQFDEPAGISAAGGKLYVADTNNHAIRTVDIASGNVATLTIEGLKPPAPPRPAAAASRPSFRNAVEIALAPATVRPVNGAITVQVELKYPEGWHTNPLAPTVYVVDAVAEKGPLERAGLGQTVRIKEPKESFEITLPLRTAGDEGGAEKGGKQAAGEDKLRLSVNHYYCQGGPEGVCKTGSVIWTVPVKIDPLAKETKVAAGVEVAE